MKKTCEPKSVSARAVMSLAPLLLIALVTMGRSHHANIMDTLRNTPIVGALIQLMQPRSEIPLCINNALVTA